MKCKVCGHRANTLKSMAEHYRKKHPAKMKRHRKIEHRHTWTRERAKPSYCPSCGEKL